MKSLLMFTGLFLACLIGSQLLTAQSTPNCNATDEVKNVTRSCNPAKVEAVTASGPEADQLKSENCRPCPPGCCAKVCNGNVAEMESMQNAQNSECRQTRKGGIFAGLPSLTWVLSVKTETGKTF